MTESARKQAQNKKNLKPQAHKLTVEEASKGGKASAKARREKKTLRELARMILEEEITDANGRTLTQGEAALRVQARKAIQDGDTKALAFMRDTSGQMPATTVEVATADQSKFSELLEQLEAGD